MDERFELAGFGLSNLRQVRPQRFVLRDDRSPVVHFPRPLASGFAHLATQLGRGKQFCKRLCGDLHIHRHQQAVIATVHVVGVDLQRMTVRQITTCAHLRHECRDAETVYAIAHGVLVTIPIRHHNRNPRRHRLDGHDAEGFLNAV